jgi:plasmid rolling circle replication initiator protein Rep
MSNIINKNIENVNKFIGEVEETFKNVKAKNVNVSYKFPTEHKEHTKLKECSQSLFTTIFQHNTTKDYKKNISFFACKSKFCPICNKIKSNKLSSNMYNIIKQLQEEQDQQFIFLTLTVKNCNIENLSDTIKRMNEAWRDLWRRYFNKPGRFNGFIKFLEITFPNSKEAHPHFHILLSVNSDYFKRSNTEYLNTKNIAELWQRVLKVDYTPICDIRIIKPKKTKSGVITKEAIPAVISEMCKYPMKDTDYKKLSKETMEKLYNELYRKRLIASGGNLKISLAKIEQVDCVEVEENEIDEWKKIAYIVMKYIENGYVIGSADWYN